MTENKKKVVYPDGRIYIGEFKDGKRHGNGIITAPSGKMYDGEFKNDLPNGIGTLTFHDGSEYIGEFKDARYNGTGTLINENGEDGLHEYDVKVYVGDFKCGKFHGKGNVTFEIGDKYAGDFIDGEPYGNGTMIFMNGDKYHGEFKDWRPEGIGTMDFECGDKYVGEFSYGLYSGFGAMIYQNGDKYVGEFDYGEPNGFGAMTYPNGDKYIGEFDYGKQDGFGAMTYQRGDKYIGEYKVKKRNGFGAMTFTDGEKYVGKFKDGKFVDALKLNNHYYLFFDTETTGLPANWKAPITDLANWPRLVQIAWVLFDKSGNVIDQNDHIIKPKGFTIPNDASSVHGITTERALKQGENLQTVLDEFVDQVHRANTLVAHNISFDERILGAELLRNEMVNIIPGKDKICTMVKTTDYVAIPGSYGNKWPSLSELHQKLFDFDFEESHNAKADINATAKCFWEARRLGIL